MSENDEPPGYLDERPPLPDGPPPERDAPETGGGFPGDFGPPGAGTPAPAPPALERASEPRSKAGKGSSGRATPRAVAVGAPTGVPHDDEAERAVVGSVFVDPDVLRDVGNILDPEDFYRESHRAIFRAFLDLENARIPIDSISVRQRLAERDELATVGGAAYLVEVSQQVPTVVNVTHYATLVRSKSQLRQVMTFGRSLVQTSMSEVEDVPRFVDEMAQSALALSTVGVDKSVVPLREALETSIDHVEKIATRRRKSAVTGTPSGFHALDKVTSGWQPSDLIILAARPGMGKTAFALNMLVNAAKDRWNPTPGVVFSLEMSKEQLATRLWCAETQVPIESLRSGALDARTWERLYDSVSRMREYPVFIDDTAALPIAEMMRKCRQLKHEHDIGIVIVDYLQLMTASAASMKASREQQISEISRNLKALAKEIHVPVIALSQLNRGVESRTDKRPMLSDLRESGAIEQDADIIVFLYRDDYYQQMKGEAPGSESGAPTSSAPAARGASTTEIIIAKHRSGSTGRIEVDFFAPYTLFANKVHDQPPPPDESSFNPRTDDANVAPADRDRPPPPGGAPPSAEAPGGGFEGGAPSGPDAAPAFEEFDEFEPGDPSVPV